MPFKTTTQTVRFQDNAASIKTSDNVLLRGRFHGPTDATPVRQIVLILPGSGNVDFDGDISSPLTGTGVPGQPEPRLSLQLAKSLGQAGIASLRYSKRGFDQPEHVGEQTPEPLIRDLISAWQQLETLAPGAQKSVMGFSEGALLAAHAASRGLLPGCSSLHLLGLPSRPIDEILEYQFCQWPIKLLQTRADPQGRLTPAQLNELTHGMLPGLLILGNPELALWQTQARLLGLADSQGLSLETDLPKIYEPLRATVQVLVALPQFSGWYQGLKALRDLREEVKNLSIPVYLHHGEDDAQVPAEWVRADSRSFAQLRSLRIWKDLGHAFAPHQGVWKDIKTSGPFDTGFVAALTEEVRSVFNSLS